MYMVNKLLYNSAWPGYLSTLMSHWGGIGRAVFVVFVQIAFLLPILSIRTWYTNLVINLLGIKCNQLAKMLFLSFDPDLDNSCGSICQTLIIIRKCYNQFKKLKRMEICQHHFWLLTHTTQNEHPFNAIFTVRLCSNLTKL